MLNQTSGEFGHPTFTNGPGRLPDVWPQQGFRVLGFGFWVLGGGGGGGFAFECPKGS